MKKKNKLILKQGIKYFIIGLLGFIGMGIYRLVWSIPDKAFYWTISVVISITVAMTIFDLISVKDIIPILKN